MGLPPLDTVGGFLQAISLFQVTAPPEQILEAVGDYGGVIMASVFVGILAHCNDQLFPGTQLLHLRGLAVHTVAKIGQPIEESGDIRRGMGLLAGRIKLALDLVLELGSGGMISPSLSEKVELGANDGLAGLFEGRGYLGVGHDCGFNHEYSAEGFLGLAKLLDCGNKLLVLL